MSIEAIAFAKITDLDGAEAPAARLLFYVIAENTFNDSGLCKVGQAELAYQTRCKERTLQRHLASLAKHGFVKIERKGAVGGGRVPDHIRILGFEKWLVDQRGKR